MFKRGAPRLRRSPRCGWRFQCMCRSRDPAAASRFLGQKAMAGGDTGGDLKRARQGGRKARDDYVPAGDLSDWVDLR